MVIEAAGIQFVAEKRKAPLVEGLYVGVEQWNGREVLVVSNSTWGAQGGC